MTGFGPVLEAKSLERTHRMVPKVVQKWSKMAYFDPFWTTFWTSPGSVLAQIYINRLEI